MGAVGGGVDAISIGVGVHMQWSRWMILDPRLLTGIGDEDHVVISGLDEVIVGIGEVRCVR